MHQSLAVYLKKRNFLELPGNWKSKKLTKKRRGWDNAEWRETRIVISIHYRVGRGCQSFHLPKLWVSLFIEYDICYLNSLWIIYELLRLECIKYLIFDSAKKVDSCYGSGGKGWECGGETGVLPSFNHPLVDSINIYWALCIYPVSTKHSPLSPSINSTRISLWTKLEIAVPSHPMFPRVSAMEAPVAS